MSSLDHDAIRARHKPLPGERWPGSDYCEGCLDDAACDAIQLLDEVEEVRGYGAIAAADAQFLRDELQDIRDSERIILDGKCAGDEIHCGCVVTYRKEVARQKDLRARELKEGNDEIARLRATIEAVHDNDTDQNVKLKAENKRLRAALRLTSHDCEFLHHSKRDAHEHGERCPAEVRVRSALDGG